MLDQLDRQGHQVLLEEMEQKELMVFKANRELQEYLEDLARREQKEKLEKKEKRDILEYRECQAVLLTFHFCQPQPQPHISQPNC